MMLPMNNFDFFVGNWNVVNRRLKDRFFQGGTEWEEFPGFSRAQTLFGGTGHIDEIEFPTKPGYTGFTLRLFNHDTGMWHLNWTSSTANARIEPPVIGEFIDGVGVFEGDDEYVGKPIRVRFTWSNITENSARWHQELSNDDGKTWELDWIMEFSRA